MKGKLKANLRTGIMQKYRVIVLGATGAVGKLITNLLEKRNFPIDKIVFAASENSKGKKIFFKGKEQRLIAFDEIDYRDFDFAFFATPASISQKYVPSFLKENCFVIDNSSAFRQDESSLLIIPEVNAAKLTNGKYLISNPNCTTIIMLTALYPIYRKSKIKKITVASYQSASGAGQEGIEELYEQLQSLKDCRNIAEVAAKTKKYNAQKFAYPLLFNAIPHIDDFLANGFTKEEAKMYHETRKILDDQEITINATCVRLPIFTAHSEAVSFELEDNLSIEELRKFIKQGEGIELLDEPDKELYPMPLFAAGQNNCFIGRIRKNYDSNYHYSAFIVGDQLLKGAALNAVQIGEKILEKKLR